MKTPSPAQPDASQPGWSLSAGPLPPPAVLDAFSRDLDRLLAGEEVSDASIPEGPDGLYPHPPVDPLPTARRLAQADFSWRSDLRAPLRQKLAARASRLACAGAVNRARRAAPRPRRVLRPLAWSGLVGVLAILIGGVAATLALSGDLCHRLPGVIRDTPTANFRTTASVLSPERQAWTPTPVVSISAVYTPTLTSTRPMPAVWRQDQPPGGLRTAIKPQTDGLYPRSAAPSLSLRQGIIMIKSGVGSDWPRHWPTPIPAPGP